MSLQNAAKYLESKGRNGDSMLVHMTPGEVKGLQALALAHGGSLSINPDTGLVEASFLKRMLPMIAGIGLNMMFPGLGTLGTAALVGGVETARTGDLGKGLMAGLGAYGGAGIGEGLAQAGQAATATNAANLAEGTKYAAMSPGTASAGLTDKGLSAYQTAFEGAQGNQATNMFKGLGNLGDAGARDIAYQAMPKYTLPAAGVGVINAATPEQAPPPGYQPDEYDKRLGSYRLSPSFAGYVPPQPNPYYRPTGLGYAAEGGATSDIMMAAGGTYDDEPVGDVSGMATGGIAAYASQGQVKHLPRSAGMPDTGIYRDTDVDTAKKLAWEAAEIRNKKAATGASMPKNFLAKQPKLNIKGIGDIEEAAAGGSIGGYSDGGRMLKGPGDGMSDSIPATIGKRQPARLADGEFVVPADVVSHIGNGSTDAGARKLYSMMDKVRKARTGKKSQAKAIKADKYMPA